MARRPGVRRLSLWRDPRRHSVTSRGDTVRPVNSRNVRTDPAALSDRVLTAKIHDAS